MIAEVPSSSHGMMISFSQAQAVTVTVLRPSQGSVLVIKPVLKACGVKMNSVMMILDSKAPTLARGQARGAVNAAVYEDD
jgi:hypothetical protein